MVAMSQALGDQYAPLVQQAGTDHASLRGLEQNALGIDHGEVGAALAEAWNLPPLLVAPIRYHEHPDAAGEDVLPLVRTVAVGNRVAEIFLREESRGDALDAYHAQVDEWFDSPRDQADPMLREIHRQTDEMGRLFDLPTGPLENVDEILSSANEALMQITLESHRRNEQLVDEVNTDSLTGASNRRAFDAFVSDSFRAATESRPVSVLFVDVDHFKTFNDTHGHAVGDRVLKVFAATLKEAVGDRGEVFRYGGEEFTIVCPGTDVAAAAIVAEDARHAVADGARVRKRDCDQELCITCSVGVATHDGGTFDSVESLIKASDRGVYAAKSAGRNCVRAHAPGEIRELNTVPAEMNGGA